MNAEEILAILGARGACVHLLEGQRLGVEPSAILTDDLRAGIRAHKSELIEILQRELEELWTVPAPPNWPASARRHSLTPARAWFAKAGVEPDQDTLEAAAWLEFQLVEGWFPRPGISEARAKYLLEDVYHGELVGGIGDGCRVVLREPTSCEWLP